MFIPNAIIFDLGGVIINLDYNRTATAFKNLGVRNFDEVYSKQKQDRLFDDFEKGVISPKTFRDSMQKHIPNVEADEQIDKAWNAMLLDIPVHRMDWLQKLSKQYPLFLLSNTNEIHIKAFTKILLATYGENIFESTFKNIYYSCRMKMRKPDAEIFEYVLNENNLSANETLFIDDSEQHIKGAQKFGLHTYHLKPSEDISDALNYRLS